MRELDSCKLSKGLHRIPVQPTSPPPSFPVPFFLPQSHSLLDTTDTIDSSMLQRISARGRALWQIPHVSRNCSRPLFTFLTKTDATTRSARHTATGRDEAGWICRPRTMMSSKSAGSFQVSETGTYLDLMTRPDIDFDRIKSHMTCSKFHDSTWGLVVRHTPHCLL